MLSGARVLLPLSNATDALVCDAFSASFARPAMTRAGIWRVFYPLLPHPTAFFFVKMGPSYGRLEPRSRFGSCQLMCHYLACCESMDKIAESTAPSVCVGSSTGTIHPPIAVKRCCLHSKKSCPCSHAHCPKDMRVKDRPHELTAAF